MKNQYFIILNHELKQFCVLEPKYSSRKEELLTMFRKSYGSNNIEIYGTNPEFVSSEIENEQLKGYSQKHFTDWKPYFNPSITASN